MAGTRDPVLVINVSRVSRRGYSLITHMTKRMLHIAKAQGAFVGVCIYKRMLFISTHHKEGDINSQFSLRLRELFKTHICKREIQE